MRGIIFTSPPPPARVVKAQTPCLPMQFRCHRINRRTLVTQLISGSLQLSWPQDHLNWRLQIQTNDLTGALGTNWADVADSTNSNSANIPVSATNSAVFLRLVYP